MGELCELDELDELGELGELDELGELGELGEPVQLRCHYCKKNTVDTFFVPFVRYAVAEAESAVNADVMEFVHCCGSHLPSSQILAAAAAGSLSDPYKIVQAILKDDRDFMVELVETVPVPKWAASLTRVKTKVSNRKKAYDGVLQSFDLT
jgi:hypothetical protein